MRKKLEKSKKPILLTLAFLLSVFCFLFFEAVANGQNPNCYRITFSDKNDSPYSINRPEEFLSARAIAKRERFNIPVIEQDLPVNSQYINSILNFSNEPSQIISKSKQISSFSVYPNPTTGELRIKNYSRKGAKTLRERTLRICAFA